MGLYQTGLARALPIPSLVACGKGVTVGLYEYLFIRDKAPLRFLLLPKRTGRACHLLTKGHGGIIWLWPTQNLSTDLIPNDIVLGISQTCFTFGSLWVTKIMP